MATREIRVKNSSEENVLTPSRELVGLLVRRHRRNSPELKIRMAIWLNAGKDPFKNGVDLVLICGKEFQGNVLNRKMPDFRPIGFPAMQGRPPINYYLTDVRELVEDVEISGVRKSFAEKIRLVLSKLDAESLIYPEVEEGMAERAFQRLMGGVV